MQIMVKLLSGEHLQYQVDADSCTIGRSPSCEVVIPHDGVSRRHCLIEVQGGQTFVTDLASTNGVLVEGVRIPANVKTEFRPYIPLSFGPVQSLMINLDDEAAAIQSSNPLLKNVVVNETMTRTTTMKEKRESVKPIPIPPKPQAKSKVDFKMVLATILALGIMAFAYHLHSQKSEYSSPATEVESSQGPVEYY